MSVQCRDISGQYTLPFELNIYGSLIKQKNFLQAYESYGIFPSLPLYLGIQEMYYCVK